MIYHGDCLEVLPTMPAESIDSIVTDPPYGLSFMGKNWDHGVPGVAFWSEALRVAKPGTHLLAFGGTRTFHRLTCAIEDAGWEIRDCIMWVYGSGFPKSLDVSKAIDKAAGAERLCTRHGTVKRDGYGEDWDTGSSESRPRYDSPATPAAQQWQGWGTALKPAWEPIIVARKPLVGTVAANVLRHGTGAINVDGCRVGLETIYHPGHKPQGSFAGNQKPDSTGSHKWNGNEPYTREGRWPANLIHDGSDEVVGLFPENVKGQVGMSKTQGGHRFIVGDTETVQKFDYGTTDTGSAARFFYVPKASKADRDEGCEGLTESNRSGESAWAGMCPECGCRMMLNGKPTCGHGSVKWVQGLPRRNHHPTVKPTALMRYLCRLVTPPGGTVLDPFCGSGSTGKAATLEGFKFIGIEREAEYAEIARARIAHARGDMPLLEAIK